jgi:hypothetical protein
MNGVALSNLLSYEAPTFAEICKSEPSNVSEDISATPVDISMGFISVDLRRN